VKDSYFSVISPFPSAQAHQLTIWTTKNLHALFAGTRYNPSSMSFVPSLTKICYRPSFLAKKFRVTGTVYQDRMEDFFITVLEHGPNVILQHDSARLLKPKFPGHVFAQAAW
jgi:hypothetical protein